MATKRVYYPDTIITTKKLSDPAVLATLKFQPSNRNIHNAINVPLLVSDKEALNIQISGGGRIAYLKPSTDKKKDEKEAATTSTSNNSNPIPPLAQVAKLALGLEITHPDDQKGLKAFDEFTIAASIAPETYFHAKPNFNSDLARTLYRPFLNPAKEKDAKFGGGFWPEKVNAYIQPGLKAEKNQKRAPLIQGVRILTAEGHDITSLEETHPMASMTLEELRRYSWKKLMFKVPHIYFSGSDFGYTKYLRMIQLGEKLPERTGMTFVEEENPATQLEQELATIQPYPMELAPPPLEAEPIAVTTGHKETGPDRKKQKTNK